MVSIIILTYNRCNLLLKSINSIISQVYNNFEIIIIDDGSTDGTEKAVRGIDNRIKYFKLDKIGNIPLLRNYGIKHSNGEYIAFCDDDDIWHKDKLMFQLQSMKKYDISCCNADLIDMNGKLLSLSFFHDVHDSFELSTAHLLLKNYICTSTILIKKNILPADPFNIIYKTIAEDYDLWLKLSLDNSIYFINKNMISYRIHPSLSHDVNKFFLMYDTSINLLNKYKKLVPKYQRKYAVWGIFKFRREYIKDSISHWKISYILAESIKLIFSFFNLSLLLMMIKKVFNPAYDLLREINNKKQ